ncbi:hypothetical protein FH972_001146 [Carpinus fangiana]|uniref:Uncharacterized protein n=1 Tax=Carpinus fangiana TaxID=176857 RepID=A0A5N6QCQ3_9ROSI|nr:hypothetical protein FH972_001146 [Carpinus fangiana]
MRKIQQQTVGDIAGGGDRRRTQTRKLGGRVWMKPPKITTPAERQDSQIYESNTPEIPTRDKKGTKKERVARKGKRGGSPSQGHRVNCWLPEQE